MIIYSIVTFIFTFFLIIYGSAVARNHAKINRQAAENFRRLWAIGSLANYTTKIEKYFGCCGWNNVFDHCSGPAMSAIMYGVINEEAIIQFDREIEENSTNKLEECDPIYEDCNMYIEDTNSSDRASKILSKNWSWRT